MQKSYIQTAFIFSSRMAMPPSAATRDRSSITDTKQAPKKSTSHNNRAQMDVPHMHGVGTLCCLLLLVLLGTVVSLSVLSACMFTVV